MNSWDMFEAIHGDRMRRCIYGGIMCLQNGLKGEMISIYAADHNVDLGKGRGQSIFVFKEEVVYEPLENQLK